MEYILGIHVGHDSTAVLLKGDEVVGAIAEERLSRIKNHYGFPYKALGSILKSNNLQPSSIDKIVFSFKDILSYDKYYTKKMLFGCGAYDFSDKLSIGFRVRLLFTLLVRILSFQLVDFDKVNKLYAKKQYFSVIKSLGFNCQVQFMDHHLSHAGSAYFSQKKDRVLLITIDGSGDGLCASVNVGEKGSVKRIYSSSQENSPGVLYAAVTKYLGFKRLRHEGKITGLAAYGKKSRAYDLLKEIFYLENDGKDFILDLKEAKGLLKTIKYFFLILTGKFTPGIKSNLLLDYFKNNFFELSREDIAWAVQKVIEDRVVEYIKKAVMYKGISDVLLAGGLFANVRLNQMISELECVKSLFVHPNMGDGGSAYGAAYLSLEFSEHKEVKFEDVYLGPSFIVKSEIKDLLNPNNFTIIEKDYVVKTAAEMLTQGNFIGVINDKMEYGPRALGNRSVLCSGVDYKVNDILNKRLNRTEFMPFAPIVLQEDFENYFYMPNCDISECLKYMTVTINIKELCKETAPAVCHIDGTARPQIVNRKINPLIYDLLKKYKGLTGISLLINTSFNVHEEPIVCSIEDALKAFNQSKLDGLIINGKKLLIRK